MYRHKIPESYINKFESLLDDSEERGIVAGDELYYVQNTSLKFYPDGFVCVFPFFCEYGLWIPANKEDSELIRTGKTYDANTAILYTNNPEDAQYLLEFCQNKFPTSEFELRSTSAKSDAYGKFSTECGKNYYINSEDLLWALPINTGEVAHINPAAGNLQIVDIDSFREWANRCD